MPQKLNQILLHHSARRFEFTLATAVKQMTVALQDRNCGHAFFQRNLVELHEVEVLFTLADVHMHEQKILRHDLPCFSLMQSSIENVTVIAPVRTKDKQDALLCRNCRLQSCSNFFLRVGVIMI